MTGSSRDAFSVLFTRIGGRDSVVDETEEDTSFIAEVLSGVKTRDRIKSETDIGFNGLTVWVDSVEDSF